MQYTETAQAILLLTCYFNKSEVKSVRPLTPLQYARLAAWLHHNKYSPASLLSDADSVLAQWQDPKPGGKRNEITIERLQQLLARGGSMAFALEHWAKQGVHAVTRACANYPQKIPEKLGETRPPVFFTVGNLELLNKPGIGFVGSREIDADDDSVTQNKAQLAVAQDFVVVSGGAKGVDQTSMLSALEQGGASIGVLADSLLRASASKAYRDGLRDNRLLLLSPFYPEAGFTPANAMARNKYIYALSEAVVVVKSALTGGTWTGANENLKHQWCPLWVRNNDHPGNQELIKLGALPMAEDFTCFNSAQPVAIQPDPVINDLFATPDTLETPAEAPSTAIKSTAETLDTTAPVTAATAPTGQPEKTVVRINPTEIFSQQTKGTYIETQAEVDAYLNALKDKLQAALDQHQRINIQ